MNSLNVDRTTCGQKELSSPYLIEQRANNNGTCEADNGQGKHIHADVFLFKMECIGQNRWVLVIYKVEEEGLCED